MIRQEQFVRDEILPSWFVNRLQDKVAPFTNLRLRQASATSIDVPAGAGDDAVVVNIAGNWRFVEANVPPKAHPGGAAGIYTIFVTAKAQNVVNAPEPNTDLTDYSFGLAIVADGSTPTIVPGTVDIFRSVGRLFWSGTAITGFVQDVASVTGALLAEGAVAVSAPLTVGRAASGAVLLGASVGTAAAQVAAGDQAMRVIGTKFVVSGSTYTRIKVKDSVTGEVDDVIIGPLESD